LFFASLMAGKAVPDARYAMVAAAIEFAQLGALTFIGPPASPPPSRGVDWAVATAVLAGDFLVAQASRLVAESAPEISWSFAEWLLELITLREAQLTGTADPADLFSSIYEFPARIGALLGDAPADTIQALRDVGFHCGRAFLHAEDILALRGERTRLDTALPAMLSGRISAIPGHLADLPVTVRDLVGDRELRQRALHGATSACMAERDHALRALSAIPPGSTVSIIGPFIDSITSPGVRL
jgi:menaquinone-9 beta-reductase